MDKRPRGIRLYVGNIYRIHVIVGWQYRLNKYMDL